MVDIGADPKDGSACSQRTNDCPANCFGLLLEVVKRPCKGLDKEYISPVPASTQGVYILS